MALPAATFIAASIAAPGPSAATSIAPAGAPAPQIFAPGIISGPASDGTPNAGYAGDAWWLQ